MVQFFSQFPHLSNVSQIWCLTKKRGEPHGLWGGAAVRKVVEWHKGYALGNERS